MPPENNLRRADAQPSPTTHAKEQGSSGQKVLALPHASTGDLLGQMDLLLTRKEEADRPGAGVGEGDTLRIVVHLGGGAFQRPVCKLLPLTWSPASATGPEAPC